MDNLSVNITLSASAEHSETTCLIIIYKMHDIISVNEDYEYTNIYISRCNYIAKVM